MKNKKILPMAIGLASLASLAIGIPAFADTTTPTPAPAQNGAWHGRGGMGMMRPGVVGTVSAISGNSITITSKIGGRMRGPKPADGSTPAPTTTPTPVTYTVDASNATVMKAGVASTVSNIAVGDTVFVGGTVTGTNVVAKTILDGLPMMGKGKDGDEKGGPVQNPVITGNGQPVVAGSITTISGNTITVTTSTGIAYTVDATNAKIVQGQNTITLTNLAVGNSVVVQGGVNGTSITASSIIDQKEPANSTNTGIKGFFGNIKGFFTHLFGF